MNDEQKWICCGCGINCAEYTKSDYKKELYPLCKGCYVGFEVPALSDILQDLDKRISVLEAKAKKF